MERRVGLGLGVALLAFLAYVSLGLPDGLLGVAWPSMRRDFSLPFDSLGALFVTTTIGYLLSSFFAGRLTARFGWESYWLPARSLPAPLSWATRWLPAGGWWWG